MCHLAAMNLAHVTSTPTGLMLGLVMSASARRALEAPLRLLRRLTSIEADRAT